MAIETQILAKLRGHEREKGDDGSQTGWQPRPCRLPDCPFEQRARDDEARAKATLQWRPFTPVYGCSSVSATVPNSLMMQIRVSERGSCRISLWDQKIGLRHQRVGRSKSCVGLPSGSPTTNPSSMFTTCFPHRLLRYLRSRTVPECERYGGKIWPAEPAYRVRGRIARVAGPCASRRTSDGESRAGLCGTQPNPVANRGVETCVSLNDRVYLYFRCESCRPGKRLGIPERGVLWRILCGARTRARRG